MVFGFSLPMLDDEYPLIMMTGRILYQYNAAAMTARSQGLMDIAGEGFIEVNYKDADRLIDEADNTCHRKCQQE